MTTHRITPAQRDEITRLRMFGVSFGQIAKRCGVSKTTAFRVAHDTPVCCSGRRGKPEPAPAGFGFVPAAGGGYRLTRP